MATVQDPLTSIDSSLKELIRINLLGTERLAGVAGASAQFQSLQATAGQQHGATLGRAIGGGIGPGAAVGEAIGGGIGKLGGMVAGLVAPFNAATTSIGGFVRASNPGLMEKFDAVLQDVTGVIGQALAPVIEALLPAVRLFGDFLASILPDASDFKDALSPLSGFLDDLRDALKSIAPVIKDVLVFGLKALGEALRLVLVPIRFVVGVLKGLFGDRQADALKSSTGAAARNIRFEDPMSAVKGVYQAAYKAVGTGPAAKEKTPLDRIQDSVDAAVKWLKGIFDTNSILGGFLAGIRDTLKQIFSGVSEIISTVVSEPSAVWNQIKSDLGIGPKVNPETYHPPDDPVRQAAIDQQAKLHGKLEYTTKAVGMLPFEPARNEAGSRLLPEMLAALREIMKKAGNERFAERDIDELLKWAGMTSRRGIEGNSGGA